LDKVEKNGAQFIFNPQFMDKIIESPVFNEISQN